MMEKSKCPHCGTLLVEYTFSFNKGLARFLTELYERGCPVKTDDLKLTYAQRTNSQKLRYWHLAESVLNEESRIKRGWWQITQAGRDFVEGKITVYKRVVMRRNQFIRFEGDEIGFNDIAEGYKYHQDYADEASQQLLKF